MATKIGSLVIQLAVEHGLLTQGMTKAENQVAKSTKQMAADLERMRARIGTVALALGSAFAGAAGAMAVMVRETINTADELSKAAQVIGTGVEELSRLRYAADLSGVAFDELQKGLLALNRNMAGIGGENGKVILDERTDVIAARIDGRVMQAAPAIANLGAVQAGRISARRQTRSIR